MTFFNEEQFGHLLDLAEALYDRTQERDEAIDALQELYDWQNGCPLGSRKWVDGWGNAMETAAKVLKKAEGKNDDADRVDA